MGRYVFRLPDLGEGVAESEIAAWRVRVGERVQEDQPLVDVLTDKAAVEIPSPVAGVVRECRGAVGERIAVGAELVVIETEAASDEAVIDEDEKPAAAPAPVVAVAASVTASQIPMTSPVIRRRARERGIDLRQVPGSGPRGRITAADFEAFLARDAAAPEAPQAGVETIRVVGLRRRIAEAMQRSSQRIAHFSYVEETDVTELEALRRHLNEHKRETQPRLTLLPFLIRALARVLPRHPQINARYDDEAGLLHRHAALHLGIATQTPQGLLVPVIRDAQRLDVWQLATEIARLATAAREGRARRQELSGSTLTLSSLGALGGIASTPIINAPEVAIVGVNRIVERPAFRNGVVVPRLAMNLSSSFDHRVVDGRDAAAFIQDLKAALEHPATMFMEAR